MSIPPPPTWAQPQLPPAWLDWFTRLAYIVTQNGGVLDGNGQDSVLTLTSFTATADGPTIKLSFANSNEDNTAFVQVFRNTVSDAGTATLQTTLAGGVNAWVDSVGASATYYYWVRPVTKGGTVGTETGPASATTSAWATIVGGSVITKVTSLPGSGAEGDVVYLTTNDKLYRYDGSSWVTWTDGADILASSVTAGKISVSSLAAITTTTGTLVVDSAGYVRGGQTAYATGTGFFLGYSGAAYKFSIGNSSDYVKWDGSTLSVGGSIIATGNIQSSAATGISSSATDTETTLSSSSWNLMSSVAITTTGYPVEIVALCTHYCKVAGATQNYGVKIVRDSTTIYLSSNLDPPTSAQCLQYTNGANEAIHFVDPSPTAASHTYYFYIYSLSSGSTHYAAYRKISAIEIKR